MYTDNVLSWIIVELIIVLVKQTMQPVHIHCIHMYTPTHYYDVIIAMSQLSHANEDVSSYYIVFNIIKIPINFDATLKWLHVQVSFTFSSFEDEGVFLLDTIYRKCCSR